MATTPAALIGRNVAAEMRRAGVTQAALGRVLDISQAAVSARLLGKTPFKSTELAVVATHLGVDVAALYPRPEAVAS